MRYRVIVRCFVLLVSLAGCTPAAALPATTATTSAPVAQVVSSPTSGPVSPTSQPPATDTARPTLTQPPTPLPSVTLVPTQPPTLTPLPTVTPRPPATATALPSPTVTLPPPTPTQEAARPTIAPPRPTATPRPASSRLRIAFIESRRDLEYIEIRNEGNADQPMRGWRIYSADGERRDGCLQRRDDQTYTFNPDFVLPAGGMVRVHSGRFAEPVPNTATTQYWDKLYIWFNNGDRGELLAPDGSVVSTRTYGWCR